MAGIDRYRALWRAPQVRPVLLVGALARLPVSMYSLAILLLVDGRTGSLVDAGLATGAAAIGYAATGPALGRLVDRVGPRPPLIGTAVLSAGAFTLLIVLTQAGAPLPALIGGAVLVGGTLPPVASCQRLLWRRLLTDPPTDRQDLLETAMAVDSFQLDVFLILGPLLIAGLATVADPTLGAAVTGALLAVGALVFAALPACRVVRDGAARRPASRGSLLGPLRSPAFLLLASTIAAAGMALGMVRIGLIGFTSQLGHPTLGGVLYTAIGVGSAVGGLWYGARHWRAPVERRYALLLGGYAVLALPLLLGWSPYLMFALAAVAGLALSPATICEFTLIGRCAPAGAVAEAYAWATTVTFVGNALGNAVAAELLAHRGWRAPVLAAAVVLAAAALSIGARQPMLRRAAAAVAGEVAT
jgi:MFS family permease